MIIRRYAGGHAGQGEPVGSGKVHGVSSSEQPDSHSGKRSPPVHTCFENEAKTKETVMIMVPRNAVCLNPT